MTPEEEYAAFKQKVKRTVYIDNLSPQVTESVLRTALDQFGSVSKVQFIPNYTAPKNAAHCALVEMASAKQADDVVVEMSNLPFMMCGMPRPVRARAAVMEMFDDRPRKPGRTIQCRWLDEKDPDFKVAKKLQNLTRKNAAEASFLLERQLDEEEKLANQQAETLKTNHRKYELIEGVEKDSTLKNLAWRYNIRIG